MVDVFIGTNKLKAAFVGTNPVKAIYVGTTKVRPSEIPATGISVSLSSTINVGTNYTATATVTPTGSTSTVSWSSSNTSIATVTKTGDKTATVKWLKGGIATITATTNNGISASQTRYANVYTPTSNTLFYAPLNSVTTNTYYISTSSYTLNNSNVTYGITYSRADTAYFSKTGNSVLTTSNSISAGYSFTIAFWIYITDPSDSQYRDVFYHNYTYGPHINLAFGRFTVSTGTRYDGYSDYLSAGWHRFVYTNDGSGGTSAGKIYVDGSQQGTKRGSDDVSSSSLRLGNSSSSLYGALSEVIWENGAWSSSQVTTDYNNTKSMYGK